MESVLRPFFEEQIRFRLQDGTDVDGGVFIGSTEFLPVETLREDPVAYKNEFDLWLAEVWKPEQEQRRAEILSLFGNPKRYTDLRVAMGRQQVVPFVGSGMSASSGLPTWSDLLRRVRDYTQCAPAELEELLQKALFEEAADLVAAHMNSRLLDERIEHNLRIDDPDGVSGPVRLLPALFPKLVVTTNLDDVLEHVYGRAEPKFGDVLAGNELGRYRTVKSAATSCLLKLHGDCRRPDSRVLLTQEYDSTYAVGGMIREEIALLYRMNSLLFLGCSLGEDRTVRLIQDVASADPNMPKHYCFLRVPEPDARRIEREGFLTERGIYPIWYDSPHEEALTALLDGLLPT